MAGSDFFVADDDGVSHPISPQLHEKLLSYGTVSVQVRPFPPPTKDTCYEGHEIHALLAPHAVQMLEMKGGDDPFANIGERERHPGTMRRALTIIQSFIHRVLILNQNY